jgi:hypothetical protein
VSIYLQHAYITEAFSTHQEMRNTCRILVGQPEEEEAIWKTSYALKYIKQRDISLKT